MGSSVKERLAAMPLNFLRIGRLVGVESSSPRSFIKPAHVALATHGWGFVREPEEGREEWRTPYYSLCHGPCDEAVHDNAIVLVCA